MDELSVEVVYAAGPAAAQQVIVALSVPAGSNVADTVRRSGLLARFPEIRLDEAAVGVYGNRVALDEPVRDGDRVEIYRALIADPKQVRRQRALRKDR